jgi:acyl-CoA thioester hydrolase
MAGGVLRADPEWGGVMELTDKAVYGFWYEEKLRFSDIDMLGHVNNVAYAALIETARLAYMVQGLGVPLPKGHLLVMVRIEIDYRAELHWPATVQIGSRLTRIGTSSIGIANGVFMGDLCAASSLTTMVLIDQGTRRPVPISAEARAVLGRQILAETGG